MGSSKSGRRTLFGLVALAAVAGQATAGTPAAGSADAALQALVAKDLRVATISYRLQTAAVDHCPRRATLSGLVVQDPSQYRADLRVGMARLYGMTDLPTVVAVVPGSAGDHARVRPGDSIVAIDGDGVAADLPEIAGRKPDGRRFTAMIARLEQAFAKGPVALTVRRGGALSTLTFAGAPACQSATELDLSPARNASADGRTVSISQGIADFARSDNELAFVIGHELSHNILGHRDFLDSTRTSRGLLRGMGGNGARIRETERQADYFGVYLVAWAGYDPHAAANFWRRMGHGDALGGVIGDGTHPGNDARIRDLARAAAEIDAERAAGRPVVPDYAAFETAGGNQ